MIFHLTVIIVLAIVQIGTFVTEEKSFLFDFSKQEEAEAKEKEELFKENISRQLDEMIRAATSYNYDEVKNIAVDAASGRKDGKEEAVKKTGEDAEMKTAIEEQATDDAVDLGTREQEYKERKEYNGPSVVSYTLVGRKASHLSIPAYRCMGGGEVAVAIVVDNAGNVTAAKVIDARSEDDKCLRKFAIRAARLSRFTISGTAPPRQTGEIVYRFVAQ